MKTALLSALALGIVLAPFGGSPAARPAPASEAPRASLAAFEKFKALEGTWVGESTRGWKEEVSFKTIAHGSAVLETSFDAHPNETMVTLISVNGEALDLTHYCVAGNQPRLRATGFADGGRSVTFTFVDAGNLPSREKGHMDKAVFRFEDSDHFSSRWTWYQDGQERWMEEIRLTRKKPLPLS